MLGSHEGKISIMQNSSLLGHMHNPGRKTLTVSRQKAIGIVGFQNIDNVFRSIEPRSFAVSIYSGDFCEEKKKKRLGRGVQLSDSKRINERLTHIAFKVFCENYWTPY